MVLPRLIHELEIVIEPLDTAATEYDDIIGEPIPDERRLAPVTIDAEVHWNKRKDREPGPDGPNDNSDGWLAFLKVDVDDRGWTPRQGDRVVSIEGEAVQLYLLSEGARRGQYDREHWLLKVPFEDRTPARD